MKDLVEYDILSGDDLKLLWEERHKRIELEAYAAEKLLARRDLHGYEGYCTVCEQDTLFSIDWLYGKKPNPNWRERLICSECGLNNRQRYAMYLLKKEIGFYNPFPIYLQEQVTPFYDVSCRLFTKEKVVGSEYFGFNIVSGTTYEGLRHENTEDLSFESETFSAIVSNDVLEHVNRPDTALSELFRVLVPGGVGLVTIPFHPGRAKTIRRAYLNDDGSVEHILPPEYHGNPVMEQPSLVISEFGWDLLDMAKNAGFENGFIRGYWSFRCGHLGSGLQLIFILGKGEADD